MKKTDSSPVLRVSKAAVDRADVKAKILDKATTDALDSVAHKNTLAVRWFVICWTILLLVGVAGIVYQNDIARANKQHIDCVIKLFATPSKPGETRHIVDLSNCQIKVSS